MDIEEIFADLSVEELLVNGACSAWVCARTGMRALASPFVDQRDALRWVQDLARRSGVRLDPLYPANGGMLQVTGLYRWHCVLPPIAVDGPLISIRRHNFSRLTLDDFGLAADVRQALVQAISRRRPLIICGATGAGKTTFLAALLNTYMRDERVIILEHIAELPCASERWMRLVERAPNIEGIGAVGMDRLLEEALRLRPERFVIGEIRGREAPTYIRSLMAGHGGSLATMHAGSVDACARRLQTLCRSYDPHNANTDYLAYFRDCGLMAMIVTRVGGTFAISDFGNVA